MTTLSSHEPIAEVIYPETDGLPMAENTLQFEWDVKIEGGIDSLFANREDVFVAGDLFWYPVQGDPRIRVAPDVLVVFGRPRGHRRSYLQWNEGGIAPQVVFEVRSPGNSDGEMADKRVFYEQHRVEEYYLYDPDEPTLEGWRRTGTTLDPIPEMQNWISPRLGIRFDLSSGDLIIYRPDGEPFATYLEVMEQRQQAREELQEVQDAERLATERADRFAAKLRELGIDPDTLT